MKKQFLNAISFVKSTAVAKTSGNKVITIGEKSVELAKLDKFLDGLVEGDDITADYFEIEEGEEVRAVVIGKRKFKPQVQEGQPEKMLDAILLYAGGKKVIAAQTMLVSNLMDAAIKAEEKGIVTPVVIVYEGKEKAKVGHYDKFKIAYLQPEA